MTQSRWIAQAENPQPPFTAHSDQLNLHKLPRIYPKLAPSLVYFL